MHCGESCGFSPRAVEMLVLRINGYGEERVASPFETVLLAIRGLDCRRAAAFDDVDDFLVDVLHLVGASAGGQFESKRLS